ncbi:TetR/AcrR family transcriptional regulator C-terminal ligand-binding domain-containing protein [Streptomyces sp. NPDC091272]|uniref:TetR/AcrR family transcriptional regulator n=1 Tax=Streptomyces sp. NPDC091272 TaxID=3365981 RepID=UPI00382D808A
MPPTSPSSTPPADSAAIAGSPKRGRARENAILTVALELVAEAGFEALTVDAVAARARASKATIYGKWKTKDEMVAEALRRQSEGRVVVTPDTGSLRQDLLATTGEVAAALRGRNGVSLVSLVEAVRDHQGLRDAARSQMERTSREIGAAIAEQARRRGELRPGADVPACLKLTLGQLLFDALFTGRVPGRDEQERLVDQVLLPLLQNPQREPEGGPGRTSPRPTG